MAFVLSDESVNRYGFRVMTAGIDIAEFIKNPVMYYRHDRTGIKMPIGRWENIRKEGNKLLADEVFDLNDPFALTIKSKVENNFLRMASLGLDDDMDLSTDPRLILPSQKRPTVVRCSVLEASVADIGVNKNTLKLGFEDDIITLSDISSSHLEKYFPLITPKNDMKQIIKFLGLPDDSTEEVVLASITKLSLSNKEVTDFLVELGASKGLKKEALQKLAIADVSATLSLISEVKDLATPAVDLSLDQKPNDQRLGELITEARSKLALPEGGKTPQADATAGWSLRDWETKDSVGLALMIEKEPQKYQALFEKSTGVKLSLEDIKQSIN